VQGLDAREELVKAEGLGNVVVGPGVERSTLSWLSARPESTTLGTGLDNRSRWDSAVTPGRSSAPKGASRAIMTP
jgi:hypothetical protein